MPEFIKELKEIIDQWENGLTTDSECFNRLVELIAQRINKGD